MLAPIYNLFGAVMNFFCSITNNNYVIALFLFAVAVKILLLPFSIKQQKNQIKGASLRPKMMAIEKLRLDLYSGMAYLYKWGAAPSYWRDGERIQAVGNATPPPGIDIAHLSVPEKCKLSMKSGQLLVMISDGAYGEETEATIAAYRGSSTKELAALLISTMEREDDMTAIVISLDPRVA